MIFSSRGAWPDLNSAQFCCLYFQVWSIFSLYFTSASLERKRIETGFGFIVWSCYYWRGGGRGDFVTATHLLTKCDAWADSVLDLRWRRWTGSQVSRGKLPFFFLLNFWLKWYRFSKLTWRRPKDISVIRRSTNGQGWRRLTRIAKLN